MVAIPTSSDPIDLYQQAVRQEVALWWDLKNRVQGFGTRGWSEVAVKNLISQIRRVA